MEAEQRLWGQKEMKQLHDQMIFNPLDINSMTADERRKALESLISIKEKCDKSLKGRACSDRRCQCEDLKKEN